MEEIFRELIIVHMTYKKIQDSYEKNSNKIKN